MTIKQEHLITVEFSDWQASVKDKDLTTAPESPSNGDRYIIAGTGGGWSAGTINDIACYVSSEWLFISPLEGMQVYVSDENIYNFYNGSSWVAIGGSGDMTKAIYDTEDIGIVDKAQALDDNNGNSASASELVKNIYNVVLLAFKVAVQGSLALFNLVDGIVDEYEDESGIDTSSSTNESYDSDNDCYSPSSESGGIDEYTKLMLHCNGTDGSTSFPDDSDSAHTVTANGDAQVDTSQKKLGTGSAQFDGTGDYLTVPDSDDWFFGSGDFTIDFWMYLSSGGGQQWIAGQRPDTSNIFHIQRETSGENGLQFYWKDGGTVKADYYTSLTCVPDDEWIHVAIVRNGTNLYIFINGVDQAKTPGTAIGTNTLGNIAHSLHIGHNGASGYMTGYIDEFRISKGIARWTSNFTPPTAEYSTQGDIENMSLISENFEAESEPDSARIVIFEEDVDAITLNTDLKAYISRDDGSTWAEATLSDEGDYDATKRILVGNVDLSASGIGSGTDMVYKLDTDNTKNLKIHGTALLWD